VNVKTTVILKPTEDPATEHDLQKIETVAERNPQINDLMRNFINLISEVPDEIHDRTA